MSSKQPSILDDCWHRFCPGTKGQFAKFLGTTVPRLQKITWDQIAEIMEKRFRIQSLGGGSRLDGFTFKFLPPRHEIFWREGVMAPGAYISARDEGNSYIVGNGKSLHHAALAAALSLWEITFRRSMPNIAKH